VTVTAIGTTIFSQTIPGASILPKGTQFKFGAPKGATGIIRLSLKENRKIPGTFIVKVKGKHAWAPGSLPSINPQFGNIEIDIGGKCFLGTATKWLF